MEKIIQKLCQNHSKIDQKSERAQDTVRDTVQTSDIADATYKGGAASGRTHKQRGGARFARAPLGIHFHYVLYNFLSFLLILGLIFEWGGDLLYYNPINSNPITPLHNKM